MRKKIFCILLALSVTLAGCGNTTTSVNSATDSSVSDTVLTPDEPRPTEKKSIDNFYEYSLEDWLSEARSEEVMTSVGYNDSVDDEVFSNTLALLEGKTYEDFPDNAGMQKLLLFQNQLRDSECVDSGVEYIQSMYQTIESTKNVNEFLGLLYNLEYFCTNRLFSTEYAFTSDGDYVLEFRTTPYGRIYVMDEEEKAFLEKELTNQFVLAGASEEEAAVKAKETVYINNLILDYFNSPQDDTDISEFWNEETYTKAGYKAPLIELMKVHNFAKEDHFGKQFYCFFCYYGNLNLYETLLTEENLPALKSFQEACLFESVYYLGSVPMRESAARISAMYNGYPLDKIDDATFITTDEKSLEEYYLSACLGVDRGHIATLYREAYITDELLAEIDSMSEAAKEKYVEMIKECDWLSSRVKEKVIQKIKKIRVDVGAVNGYSSYEDVEIGGNPVETLLSFISSNKNYSTKYLLSDEGLPKYSINFYSTNGNYCNDSNSALISFGAVKVLADNMNESYETKLGCFGSVLLHEFAHALTPDYFLCGVDGIYMEFSTEKDNTMVWNGYDDFALAIQGLITENGNSINGWRCCNEYVSDILCVNCSLRMLEDLESPDYDAFFTSYSRGYGMVLSPSCESAMMNFGTHILGSQRINSVLYNFDKFYEVYDIDGSNQYYISSEKRKIWY